MDPKEYRENGKNYTDFEAANTAAKQNMQDSVLKPEFERNQKAGNFIKNNKVIADQQVKQAATGALPLNVERGYDKDLAGQPVPIYAQERAQGNKGKYYPPMPDEDRQLYQMLIEQSPGVDDINGGVNGFARDDAYYKKYNIVANELKQRHPDWTPEQIGEQADKITYRYIDAHFLGAPYDQETHKFTPITSPDDMKSYYDSDYDTWDRKSGIVTDKTYPQQVQQSKKYWNSRDDKKLKNWGLRDDYYRWGKDWKASQDPEAAATMNSIIDGVQGIM